MNEFISDNWWWLIIAVPSVLLAIRQLVVKTPTKFDDAIFLPILNALAKILELFQAKRGK